MRLIKGLVVTGLVLGLVLVITPFASKWYLKHWLNQKGFEVTIKHIGVNYFVGSATVFGASLSKSGSEQASVFQLELDFDVQQLLKGRLVLDSLMLDNLDLNVSKTGRNWAFAGMTLDQWLGGAQPQYNILIRRLEVANADICASDRQQCLRLERLSVGSLKLAEKGEELTLAHSSPLFVSKVFLQDRKNTASVFYLGALELQESSFSRASMSIKGFNLKNLQLVESQPLAEGEFSTPYQTQLGELSIGELNVGFGSSPSIRLSNVNLISLRQAVQRQLETKTIWPKRIENWFPDFYDVWQGVRFDGQGETSVDFSDIEIQGARFNWKDDTVTPSAIANVSQIKLLVDTINSHDKPKTKITWSSKLGENGVIRFTSDAQFFEGEPLFNTVGVVQGLDLANLSGYTDTVFKQRITEGGIDVSFDVGAAGGQVAGQSKWRLTGLNSEAVDATMSRSFKALADHNNQVVFEVPVGLALEAGEGSFVSLGHAVNSALVDAAKKAPAPSRFEAHKGAAVSFAPLFFGTGQVTPATFDLSRIPSIIKEVKSRPNASIAFCPVATRGEWVAMFNRGVDPDGDIQPKDSERYKLLDLTERRGNTIKRMFISQGVNPAKINICDPKIDTSKGGPSLASLSIQ